MRIPFPLLVPSSSRLLYSIQPPSILSKTSNHPTHPTVYQSQFITLTSLINTSLASFAVLNAVAFEAFSASQPFHYPRKLRTDFETAGERFYPGRDLQANPRVSDGIFGVF